MPRPKIGSYKNYLRDFDSPIPRCTAWRLQRNLNNDLIEDENMEQPAPLIEQENMQESEHDAASTVENMDQGSSGSLSDYLSSNDETENEDEHALVEETNEQEQQQPTPHTPPDSDRSSSNSDDDRDDDDNDLNVNEALYGDEYPLRFHPEVDANEGILQNVEVVEPRQLEEEHRQPLYNGCKLTAAESDLLIMSFVIRWGLQDKSIEDLLKLIDCHMPYPVLGSKYLFLKKFPSADRFVKFRYFCPECADLLPDEFVEEACEKCGYICVKQELKQEESYFLQLSITEQIKQLLSNDDVAKHLRKDCEETDIVKGMVYRNLRLDGVIGDDDLTLQWNFDGLQPFKSAKCSVVPIQAEINELPYSLRRDNMILCGLYCGKKKPPVNSFLKPFVDELQQLHFEGLQLSLPGVDEPKVVKLHTLLASVDSIARPVLQGLKQFNGRYGCCFCLRRGTRIARGRGEARVYIGREGAPRTLHQHLNALQSLEDYNSCHRKKKTHHKGVKQATVLLLLPQFNIISSFVPDYLHAVLEGVVKTFLNHWKSSDSEQNDWFLSKAKLRMLNARFESIMPPVEITRVARSVDEIALWKASEFRHFLLYYSLTCLKGLLPSKYLNHWFLLVYGMNVFLKDKISHQEFLKAKAAVFKFVESISTIYPECYYLYTFNVHLLLHIPDAVDNFGALWASSTFPYEHYNGVLAKLFKGTQSICEQMCRSFLRLRYVTRLSSAVFSNPLCSDDSKALSKKLLSKYRSSHVSERHGENLRLFGSCEVYEMSLLEKVEVQRLLRVPEIMTTAKSFRRMIFKGTVFHAADYESLSVRENSTAKFRDNTLLRISRILLVAAVNLNCEVCVVIGEKFDEVVDDLCHDRQLQISTREFMSVCRGSGQVVSRLPKNIDRKCVQVPRENNEIGIIPLTNSFERD